MRLSGHTPLSEMSAEKISPAQKVMLSSLWVESIEEFTAMMAAVESFEVNEAGSSVVNPLRQVEAAILEDVSEESLASWRRAAPGGMLGCKVRPETMQMYNAYGRLSIPGSVAMEVSSTPLPPSIRLMDKLFPIRDQGNRGTCVAFATTALREYISGCDRDLSEQFLYWACKQLDGMPDESGTYIHISMSALSTLGICREDVWPYNPEMIAGNESQAPPPDSAKDAAREYIMVNSRSIVSNSVNHYKYVLAGTDDSANMPIVLGMLVFDSWFLSAASRQSGKITMPLPGEQPVGGHAMLIVGYQDDPSVPGGGYFIARNSWSEHWAGQSPEAAGHALVPYAYIEQYAIEAFSGQVVSRRDTNNNETTETSSVDKFESEYITTLRQEQRDKNGKLLSAGTRVIRNPGAPAIIVEDTESHRKEFQNQDFSWDLATRQGIWLSTPAAWQGAYGENIHKAERHNRQFSTVLEENIISAQGYPLPDIYLPWWTDACAWLPKIKHVARVADLSDELIDTVCRAGHLPTDIPLPPEWRSKLRQLNTLRIYRLAGSGVEFHVVVAFITPLRFSRRKIPELAAGGVALVPMVQDLYFAWAKASKQARFVFFSLATASSWSAAQPSITRSAILLLSRPEDSGWATSLPPQFSRKRYFRDFVERLSPETRPQRIARIKNAVDSLIAINYGGNILLDKIAGETGYRRGQVAEAFRMLQESGQYECYRVNAQVALRKRKGRRGIRFSPDSSMFVRYHLGFWGGTFLGTLGWKLVSYFTDGMVVWTSMALILVFAYVGKCMEIMVKRNQPEL